VDAYLDRPHARLAYQVDDVGAGTPVLVAHSFLASRELEDTLGVFDWSPLRADDHPLIRFDARGHGASTGEAVEAHYQWPALADDLLAVMHHALPRTALVDGIGQSTGCGTLLWAVTREPQRFRRLVLVIPPTIRDQRREQAGLYTAAADLIKLRGPAAWERLVDAFPPVPLLDQGGWARARNVPVDIALLPSVLRGAASSDLPPDGAIAALAQETLILSWSSDPNHPVESAELLADLLPHSAHQHATHPDQVRHWGRQVTAFLAD
jgi:3-oxoadipate enol-lactonase